MGNPQSFNRFSYVENQPTNFVDPSGLLRRTICQWWHYVWNSGPYKGQHVPGSNYLVCTIVDDGGTGSRDVALPNGGGVPNDPSNERKREINECIDNELKTPSSNLEVELKTARNQFEIDQNEQLEVAGLGLALVNAAFIGAIATAPSGPGILVGILVGLVIGTIGVIGNAVIADRANRQTFANTVRGLFERYENDVRAAFEKCIA